jgi:hypothetical protein
MNAEGSLDIKKKILQEKFISPLIISLACIITFAPQIPFLGFVLDDWMFIDFYGSQGLPGLMTYFFMDNRPMAFWLPWIGFNIFGTNPLGWQIWTLFWKIMIALAMWLMVRKLFPDKPVQSLLIGLLIALYPVFRQQSSALQLSVHMICFFLVSFSMYLTVCALKHSKYWLAFSLAALFLSLIQIFTTEFFAGFELARVVIIWLVLSQSQKARLKRILMTLKQWLPYLIIWVGWAVWRVAVMPTPGHDRNSPGVVLGLLRDPVSGLLNIVQMAIQDSAAMILGVWNSSYTPATLSFTPPSNLFAWLIVALIIVLASLAIRWVAKGQAENRITWQLWLGGCVIMLMGFLPGWAIGDHFASANQYNDRYGLAAIPGAALLIVTGLGLLIKNMKVQSAIVILLIGLGAGYHVRSLAPFRYSHEEQQDFYSQLKWRAPQLTPPVALIGNGQLIDQMGDWFLSPALDHLYAPSRPNVQPQLWYFDVNDHLGNYFSADGATIHISKYERDFTSATSDSLVIQYNPAGKQCLWILSAEDINNPYIVQELKPFLQHSNLQKIKDGSDVPADTAAFGANYPVTWCYYYQKGSLAAQSGQWDQVITLWQQAAQKGLQPRIGPEFIPFIKAAAVTGQWDMALELSSKADNPKQQMQNYICQTWAEIKQSKPRAAGLDAALQKANADLGCKN